MTNFKNYLHDVFVSLDNVDCSYQISFSVDFQKAFDKVNHSLLQDKFQKFGVQGACLKLIESYITGRQQRVKIENFLSISLQVYSRVPQASLLVPLFILAFVNDLECVMPLSFGYVDDFKAIGTNSVTIAIEIKICQRQKEFTSAHKRFS